ncbi:MAG: CPBP family intramembrane metalloprotease [Polyangiaceae bacterium]|nr:CPBP family intramembrane metalloprotease [Polyangiaceae bacterium]
MSILAAFLWTFAATVALVAGLQLTGSAQLGARIQPMAVAAWEALVYVAMAAGVLRVHARGERPSKAFGLEHLDLRLVLLASLIGGVAQLPVETLRRAAQALSPVPTELQAARAALLAHSTRVDAIAILISLAVVAPLAEEVFFRGALHGQLRRLQGPVACGAIVALCFVIGHPDTQSWLPLALVAAMLSLVRERTHSLWPGFALHATFNAVTVVTGMTTVASAPAGLPLPWPVLWAGWPVSAGLCYMLYRAARR